MTRTMYDSTAAADCPKGGDLYAGYIDGSYPSYAGMVQDFPDAAHVRITVSPWIGPADVLDVEKGDATPDQAPGWVGRVRGQGVERPALYCNRGNVGAVTAALRAAGVATSDVSLWIATLDGTVDGPGDVDGYTIVACQDKGAGQTGGHYDESVVFDQYWPGSAPVAASPVAWGDDMQSFRMTVHIENGHGWAPLPPGVTADQVEDVVMDDQSPDLHQKYDVIPDWVGVSSDKPELEFGPGGDGPAPDGYYGLTLNVKTAA